MNSSFIIHLRPRLDVQYEALETQLQQLEATAADLAQQLLESGQRSDTALEETRKNVKDLGESIEQHAAMNSELRARAEAIAEVAKEFGDDSSATADDQSAHAVMTPIESAVEVAKSLLLSNPFYVVFSLTAATGLVASIYRYFRE